MIISAIKKLKNLGKVMGIVSAIIVPISIYGNYTNIKLQKERLELYKTDTTTIKQIIEHINEHPNSSSRIMINELRDSISGNEIDIFKKQKKKLLDFFQAKKNDYRNDILQNIQNSIVFESDKILLRKLKLYEDFHNENILISKKLFDEIENEIKLYNFNLNQQIKANEFINSINYVKDKNEMINIIITKITFELRNLIDIKKECKLTITKNTIFFNKEECNNNWNNSLEKLENYIIDLNELKKELIDNNSNN
jgi:hypothetical protein